MKRSLLVKLLALVLAALVIAGCGDDDSSSTGTDPDTDAATDGTDPSDDTDTADQTDESEPATDGEYGAGVANEVDFCRGVEEVSSANKATGVAFTKPSDTDISAEVDTVQQQLGSGFEVMLDSTTGAVHDDIQAVYDINVDSFAAAEQAGAKTVDEFIDEITKFGAAHTDQQTDAAAATLRVDDVAMDRCDVGFANR